MKPKKEETCNRLQVSKENSKDLKKEKLVELDGEYLAFVGLPRKFWFAKWDKVPENRAKDFFRNYVMNIDKLVHKGRGLLIYGPNRHGKTSVAALILMEAMKRCFSAYFIRAGDFIKAEYHNTLAREDQTFVEIAKEADLLVIDDLGKECENKYGSVSAVFDNLLRYRESWQRSTIITTNIPMAMHKEFFKTSMISLMTECMVPILVDGKDFSEELRGDYEEIIWKDISDFLKG